MLDAASAGTAGQTRSESSDSLGGDLMGHFMQKYAWIAFKKVASKHTYNSGKKYSDMARTCTF